MNAKTIYVKWPGIDPDKKRNPPKDDLTAYP